MLNKPSGPTQAFRNRNSVPRWVITIVGYYDDSTTDPTSLCAAVLQSLDRSRFDHNIDLLIVADDGETRSRHTLESILEHKWSVSAYDRIDIVITATGSKVKQPTLSDAIWQVVYNRPLPTGRWKSSGILEVRFDAELFLGFGALTPDTHLVSIMDTIVRTQAPYYGYIEIASFDEVQGGTYYGNTPHWPVSFHRAINHVEWLSLGETRRDRVRDLFWAQYLNVDAATRLGSTFGRQYTELKWQGESAGQIVKPYPNGDLFFSVSRTPFDFVISSPDGWLSPEILNAVWLRRELRRAGLL